MYTFIEIKISSIFMMKKPFFHDAHIPIPKRHYTETFLGATEQKHNFLELLN